MPKLEIRLVDGGKISIDKFIFWISLDTLSTRVDTASLTGSFNATILSVFIFHISIFEWE